MSLFSALAGKAAGERAEFLARQQPIIIMGRGHSGTRVLSWLCDRLGLNLGADESRAPGDVGDLKFSETIKKAAGANIGVIEINSVDERSLRKFQKSVERYHNGLGAPEKHWGWKFPETYLSPALVEATFPRAIYLHMVRNGKDIAFKKHLTDDPNRPLGRKVLAEIGALDRPRYMQAALSWAYQVDNFDRFKKSLPPERLFELKFEDLCTEPTAVAEDLCRFLKIEMTPEAEKYLAENIMPEKVGQFKENDPKLVAEVETAIRPTLIRWGYAASE